MNKHIVIFDMDGTLVDSAQDITSAINMVRHEIKLSPLNKETIIDAINGKHEKLAKIFYDTDVYVASHRDMFESFYHDECIKNVYLYEGVLEVLKHLRNNNVACSVATNAPSNFAKRILNHLNVDHYFDYIYGADHYTSKPHPEMIHAILSNYGYDKTKDYMPLMVGDSIKDVLAGENAFIKPVHIQWGFSKESLKNSIKHPEKLLDHINII